jgi:hypothetical protein
LEIVREAARTTSVATPAVIVRRAARMIQTEAENRQSEFSPVFGVLEVKLS